VRWREQFQQREVTQSSGPLELARGRLVRDDVVEGHHRPRDQVPIFSQAQRQHGLEIPVVVPMAIVQFKIIELIRDGPDAAHRVGKLSVQLARRRFSGRGFGDRAVSQIFAIPQRQAKRKFGIRTKRLADCIFVCIDLRKFYGANDWNHRKNSQCEDAEMQTQLRPFHMAGLSFCVDSKRATAIKPLPSRYLSLLLPISQGSRPHWTKSTELLNFDVVGASGL
jgi:hypothetical protein